MTTVADDKIAKVARNLHSALERTLKGSLDPDDLVLVLAHLAGKGARARNLLEYARENCPKINWIDPTAPKAKREKKGSAKTFDEPAFFQNRAGRWVDSDLEKYVGLKVCKTRGAAALKQPRLLSKNESEEAMFGQLGTVKHAEILANVCDLGQLGELIVSQEGGVSGVLLNNGYANIFPAIGKNGALCVVRVRWSAGDRGWRVSCRPFLPGLVWRAGRSVFSN